MEHRPTHYPYMTATTLRIGSIDWVDLSTPDAQVACSFYAAALGWTFEHSESPMGTYHIAMVGGHQAAGLMASEPGSGTPSAWTVFVRVASMEETVAAVINSDGKVLAAPFEIPGGAQVAVVADPTGAVFALIAGGPEPDEGEPPLHRAEPGAVAWCELLTLDPHTAVGFYDAVFGWQAVLDAASGYSTFRHGDSDVGGMLPMPEEVPAEAPSHWFVYFHSQDLAATITATVNAGGAVMKPTTTVGPVTFALLADPAHAMFGLLDLASTD